MANGYAINNELLKSTEVDVGASESDTVVSNVVAMSAADSKNLRVRVILAQDSTAREATGVTFSLQHAHSGDNWEDVGSQAQVSPASTLSTVADADVSSAGDTITSTAHPFETGDAVYYVSSAGNNITGLSDDTVYYVIDASTDTFQLATTKANAIAGTQIDITQPAGGDTHYFTSVEPMDIILNIENSSDEAQLPLFPKVRLVADSGASDAVTVSQVWFTRRL